MSQRSVDWWRRALSWYRNLSLGQEQSAKTMTSLLIIPSVLAKVLFINGLAGFVTRAQYFFFLFLCRIFILRSGDYNLSDCRICLFIQNIEDGC